MCNSKRITFKFNVKIDPSRLFQGFIVGPFNFVMNRTKGFIQILTSKNDLKYGHTMSICVLGSVIDNFTTLQRSSLSMITIYNSICQNKLLYLFGGIWSAVFFGAVLATIELSPYKHTRITGKYLLNGFLICNLTYALMHI
jgi:hypothetical protein